MEAVLEGIRLKELPSRRGAEQKSRGARADELFEHRREGCAKVNVALAVLCFHIRLDFAALRFLANVECAAVFGNVLADFEAKGFAGTERTASR